MPESDFKSQDDFSRACNKLQPVVCGYAYQVLGNREDAEDCAQQALINAVRHWKGFRGDCSLKTWLLRICSHECISLLRRRKQPTVALIDEVVGCDAIRETETKIFVEVSLSHAPPEVRQALLLYSEGLTWEEIAEELKTCDSTIRTQVRRWTERMREANPLQRTAPAKV